MKKNNQKSKFNFLEGTLFCTSLARLGVFNNEDIFQGHFVRKPHV